MFAGIILAVGILWVSLSAIRYVVGSSDWRPALFVTASAVAEIFALAYVSTLL